VKERREREAWVRGVTEDRDKPGAGDDRISRHGFRSRYLNVLSGHVFTSMIRFTDGLHTLAVTAWVGALWAIGLLAAPTLFEALPDRSTAGLVAGRMFLYVAVLGLGWPISAVPPGAPGARPSAEVLLAC
jgi:hypothetical protein